MKGRFGTWLIAGVVVAAALYAVLSGERIPPPLGRGSAAPDFELPRLQPDQAPVSLSGLRGEVVLVNFWATWCKPCEDEMPAMERLYGALKGQGFELLAISEDDEPELVTAFVARLGLSFPILMDRDRSAAHAYQTFRFPESFLVDRDGPVVERYIGPKDWDAPAYVDRIQRLLRDGA